MDRVVLGGIVLLTTLIVLGFLAVVITFLLMAPVWVTGGICVLAFIGFLYGLGWLIDHK